MTPDDREDKIERDMFGHGWGAGRGGPAPLWLRWWGWVTVTTIVGGVIAALLLR